MKKVFLILFFLSIYFYGCSGNPFVFKVEHIIDKSRGVSTVISNWIPIYNSNTTLHFPTDVRMEFGFSDSASVHLYYIDFLYVSGGWAELNELNLNMDDKVTRLIPYNQPQRDAYINNKLQVFASEAVRFVLDDTTLESFTQAKKIAVGLKGKVKDFSFSISDTVKGMFNKFLAESLLQQINEN